MNRVHATEKLSQLTQSLIVSLLGRESMPFLAAWPLDAAARTPGPARSDTGTASAMPASALPVLRWLPRPEAAAGFAANLVGCLFEAAPSLAWRQTYGLPDVDARFLDNYGYTELVGPNAPLRSAQIACGFLLLGPDTLYPRHRHEAKEIYVPLSGNAQWLQGDETWREHSCGRVIRHDSEESHAMKSGTQPLLALYLWSGANLNRKARLVAAEAPAA